MCRIDVSLGNPEDLDKLWDNIGTMKDLREFYADHCRRMAIDYEVALLNFAREKRTRRVYVVRDDVPFVWHTDDPVSCVSEIRFAFYSYDDRRDAFFHIQHCSGHIVVHNLDKLITMSEEHFVDLGRCADAKVSKAAREYRDAMSKWKFTKTENFLQKRV